MNEYLTKATGCINEAVEYDNGGNYQQALSKYQIALDWLEMALKYAPTESTKKRITRSIREYLDRAEVLKLQLETEKKEERKRIVAQANGGTLQSRVEAAVAAAKDGGIKEAMINTALGDKPKTRLADVAGLIEAKRALREAVLMPIQAPHLWGPGESSWSGILLYGPPGTGKSFLASAIAGEAGCTFFSVSTSDLISKWVGQSEQQIKALFEAAREKKPSIIFIDEVESVLTERSKDPSSSSGGHADRVVAELLSQLDGVGKDNSGILFLCATNLPWALDTAGLRRTEKRIYIPLPDEEARSYLLTRALVNKVKQETLDDLVACSHGYSGADLKVFLKEVSMLPRRRIAEATHFKGVSVPGEKTLVFFPCEAGDPDGLECSFDAFENKELLRAPKLTHEDYLECLKRTRPTVDKASLVRYEEWTRTFGVQ